MQYIEISCIASNREQVMSVVWCGNHRIDLIKMRIKNRSKYLSILIANLPRIDYDWIMNESMNLMIESIAIASREYMNDDAIKKMIDDANQYASHDIEYFELIRDDFIESHFFDDIIPEMIRNDAIIESLMIKCDISRDDLIKFLDDDDFFNAIDSIFASRIQSQIDQK